MSSVVVCVCMCVLSRFSHVWLFENLWTVALQAPLSMAYRILQARILEWVTMPSSRHLTQGTNPHLLRLLQGRQILYCWATWEALYWRALNITMKSCTRHLDYLHAKLLQNMNKLIDHMLGRTVSLSVNHPSPHRKRNCEVKWNSFSCVWLFVTPWTIYSPWNSPGQNTGVGGLSHL